MNVPRESLSLLTDLLQIPGPSLRETAVIGYIAKAVEARLPFRGRVFIDSTHEQFGGTVGNLIVHVDGELSAPRRLLSAHVDTVPLCVGSRPLLKDGFIVSGTSNTALGADNRTGVAALLTALLRILESDIAEVPPATFLFSVAEEIGMKGVRHLVLGDLKSPEFGFNFDGGRPDKVTLGANGKEIFRIVVHGVAAHAGCNPKAGVNAINVASEAIAGFDEGFAERGVTVNIGLISGGETVNVVAPKVEITGEIRSRSREARDRVKQSLVAAFNGAAGRRLNSSGSCARVTASFETSYEAFSLSPSSPPVLRAVSGISKLGLKP
jgi:tripeptide aminopeptidase